MKSALVTQSFGRESEYRRVILMIWSFYAHFSGSAKVILYTDNPDYFKSYFSDLEVEYVLLTPAKIKQMRGEIDFLHRMKIALIDEAFRMTEGNLLYADSDTFFIADPLSFLERVSAFNAFMHIKEYEFESLREMPLPAGETFRAFVSLIDKNIFKLADGTLFKVLTNQASWNAGVMMFHQSHADFIPHVYALTDQFYPATQNHASEQYAFSVVFQNKLDLHACHSVVYHYWHWVKKKIVDEFLRNRINDEWSVLSAHIKSESVKNWVELLPAWMDKHALTLKNNAIQAFHERKFMDGYVFSARAFWKNPTDKKFIRDVMYHTRILILGK